MTDSPCDTPARYGWVGQIRDVLRFVTTHSLAESWQWLISKDAPTVVQFAKYGACGVLATLAHNVAAWWFSRSLFPAFEGAPVESLKWNQIYANLLALPIGNVVAYVANVLWVFTSGRHRRSVEFLLFTLVTLISGGAGILAGPWLRDWLGTGWWAAQLSLIVASVLVNFLCRKFFVFLR